MDDFTPYGDDFDQALQTLEKSIGMMYCYQIVFEQREMSHDDDRRSNPMALHLYN